MVTAKRIASEIIKRMDIGHPPERLEDLCAEVVRDLNGSLPETRIWQIVESKNNRIKKYIREYIWNKKKNNEIPKVELIGDLFIQGSSVEKPHLAEKNHVGRILDEFGRRNLNTEFEHFCSEVLRTIGVKEVELTPPRKDGGRDITGTVPLSLFSEYLRGTTLDVVAEVKNREKPDIKSIRALKGVMKKPLTIGLFISRAEKYSEDQKRFAKENRITLLNKENLVKIVLDNPSLRRKLARFFSP